MFDGEFALLASFQVHCAGCRGQRDSAQRTHANGWRLGVRPCPGLDRCQLHPLYPAQSVGVDVDRFDERHSLRHGRLVLVHTG